jgi:hypothetical protein
MYSEADRDAAFFMLRISFHRYRRTKWIVIVVKTVSQRRTTSTEGKLFSWIGGKMARLVLNCDGVDLVTHELVDDIVMIGRAQSNHIIIDHLTVSAQHALLLRVGDCYLLKDLNSTNGTQINGVLVTDSELRDGDKIRFGGVTVVFAGRCCKRRSKRGLRRFWTTISV